MEENTCFSIADFLTFKDVPTLVPELTNKEKRQILMSDIYQYYLGEKDKRRKENWGRYVAWLKENRINEKILGREKNLKKFMKSPKAIKEFDLARLTYFMNYLPTADLPYFVSTGREFSHTGSNFTAWLSAQIFAKK